MDYGERAVWKIETIGLIHSCYKEKFGIPRQPGLVDKAHAYLELLEPYNRQEMVKDLDQFSHLWILFLFHETIREGWHSTVRPPGLGGQRRVGVFASRSPHRPNHLGMSVVRLISRIEEGKRLVLELAGGDFLDRTPVVDIKPYLPYCDNVDDARGGYSGESRAVEVVFSKEAASFCNEYERMTQRDLRGLVSQVLGQDPRPASQCGRKKIFGILLWDVNVRWSADGDLFRVIDCCLNQGLTVEKTLPPTL